MYARHKLEAKRAKDLSGYCTYGFGSQSSVWRGRELWITEIGQLIKSDYWGMVRPLQRMFEERGVCFGRAARAVVLRG